MIRKIEYRNFAGCLEIGNDDAKLIVSTDFGPRILSYSLDDGENILGWHGEAAVETELGTWKPYGGHRLWIAPENMPMSYTPDNSPVEYEVENDLSVKLVQPVEPHSNTQKEMRVSLAESGSDVVIDHKIINLGDQKREISAWALTIMASGGEVIIPNEPFAPYGSENLLPVRSMAVWSYTDLTDPRFKFEKESIRLRVDENINTQQKIGFLNKQGWGGYRWKSLMFVKRFNFVEEAIYPDMNSNFEVYTDGGYVEIETLSPLQKLKADEAVSYQERWELGQYHLR